MITMVQTSKTSGKLASAFDDAPDERQIAAVIHAETQAFVDADYAAWAACWVQEARTQQVCISAMTGLSVLTGWPAIAVDMRNALENGAGCGMVRFRQTDLRVSIDGPFAWVVFDGRAEDRDGATWETFETRILERGRTGWRIVYCSFVEQRTAGIDRDCLSVDKDGHLVRASPAMLERLRQHPLLTVSAGRIRARRLDWDRALQKVIAQAGAYHGFFDLRRFAVENGAPFRFPAVLGDTDDGGVAVVHVSVRDCATQIDLDGDGSLDRRLAVAQAVFGLSDGQVRVARHIADGVGLKGAAKALGVTVNTTRTHLARLYEKTGVASQTALVRLLLSVG